MQRIKKSLIFSACIFSSTISYAATPINTVIAIPDMKSGFEFSIAALALKPSATNLNYAIYNKELPAQTPGWTEEELRPEYAAAFELATGYRFSQGNDLRLSWTHLNSTTTSSVTAPSADYFIGPDYEIGPNGLSIRHADGRVNFRYDVINLDAGQYVAIGQHISMRFFAGISDAFLREQTSSTYTGDIITPPFAGPFSMEQIVKSNFTGIGPRIGFETDYHFDCGLGFVGEAAGSALIGSSYSKSNFITSSAELTALYGQSVNDQIIADQTFVQVIPGFDAKLGMNYKYKFMKKIWATLELGYQGAVYINAINQYLPSSVVEPFQSGGIFVDTMSHTQSNYSVQGPYLKATIDLG